MQTAIVSSEFAFSRPSSFNNLIITEKVKNCHWRGLYLMICPTAMLVLHSLARLIIYHCMLIFKLIFLNKCVFFLTIWKIKRTCLWYIFPISHVTCRFYFIILTKISTITYYHSTITKLLANS